MDFDISHLSPQARKRLAKYFNRIHLPKAFWLIPVAILVAGIGCAFYLDQVCNHNTAVTTTYSAVLFLLFCGYFAWILKKEPQAGKKFKEKFLAGNVFPKCFECAQDNPDKREKCAFCGADLKIKLLDESTPNGILSFNNLQTEKPAKISLAIISYAGSALTLLYLSLSFNLIFLIYHWFVKDDIGSYDKDFTSYLEAKSDVNDGIVKYLIPRPGGNSESDSGKLLNGAPVYYTHYDVDNKGFGGFGITLQESDKTLAINRAISYNKYISKVIK